MTQGLQAAIAGSGKKSKQHGFTWEKRCGKTQQVEGLTFQGGGKASEVVKSQANQLPSAGEY